MTLVFRRIVLLGGIFALLLAATAPSWSADSEPSPAAFLRAQNVLSKVEERFSPERMVTRAEWVRWVLRNQEFFGDAIVREPFRDVANNSYISKAWREKAISTNPLFAPDAPITVEQAMKVLLKLQGITLRTTADEGKWTDLSENSELSAAMRTALGLELVEPINDEKSGAQGNLTFQQATQILQRFQTDASLRKTPSGKGKVTIKPLNIPVEKRTPEEQKLDYIWQVVRDKFLNPEKVKEADLSEGAIEGLLEVLGDKYTTYLPPQKSEQFSQNISGVLEGIGAQLELTPEQEIAVVVVFPKTPAERFGLRPGDIILRINDVDMTGKNTEEAAALIKGPKGTDVTLTVRRGSETKELKITRDVIHIQYVSAERKDDILEIKVLTFGSSTAAEFRAILDQYLQDKSIRGVLIDLRKNPGGELRAVLKMLADFLPAESAGIWEQRREDVFKQEVIDDGEVPYLTIPLVVLVDKDSASASEIFAGAIQDYGRGLVVGTTTFGKGTVQQVITFQDKSALKISVAYWLTPDKRKIDGVGITPDVVVEPSEAGDKALEVGRNLIKRGQAKPKGAL